MEVAMNKRLLISFLTGLLYCVPIVCQQDSLVSAERRDDIGREGEYIPGPEAAEREDDTGREGEYIPGPEASSHED